MWRKSCTRTGLISARAPRSRRRYGADLFSATDRTNHGGGDQTRQHGGQRPPTHAGRRKVNQQGLFIGTIGRELTAHDGGAPVKNRSRVEEVIIGALAIAILWILAGIAPHVFDRGPDEDISRVGALLTALPLVAAGVALVVYAVRSRWQTNGQVIARSSASAAGPPRASLPSTAHPRRPTRDGFAAA